jgi:hypothetical protein
VQNTPDGSELPPPPPLPCACRVAVVPLPVVHISDVAEAHVTALTCPMPPLRRIVLVAEVTSALAMSRSLSKHFRPLGYPCITRRMPSAFTPIAKVRGGG